MPPLKLWLLDADVIIDLLSLDVFGNLVKGFEVFACSTVINEVKFFKKADKKEEINFRKEYVDSGLVKELFSSHDQLKSIISRLSPLQQEIIHPGELESLAVLVREEKLTFCCCDAATIRILPFLDVSDRGISVEKLLRQSGLSNPELEERHTEKYFKNNLDVGKREKIYSFGSS
ncbi:MAG TPA: hypothetical protein VI914_04795 [Thermodesulfobacteriota bacterium]|nr:hypothetical protein [Thermodesulfobacteriota bacterium]